MQLGFFWRGLVLLAILLASACSQLPQRSDSALWAFEGKFAWRSDTLNQTGYLRWHQYQHSFNITLWGSLGLGTTKVSGNAKRVRVDDGKTMVEYQATELVEMLPDVLLPLADIITASRDLPTQNILGQRRINNSGDWFIETLKLDSSDDQPRPAKMQISDGDHHTLIILIKQWL